MNPILLEGQVPGESETAIDMIKFGSLEPEHYQELITSSWL